MVGCGIGEDLPIWPAALGDGRAHLGWVSGARWWFFSLAWTGAGVAVVSCSGSRNMSEPAMELRPAGDELRWWCHMVVSRRCCGDS